MTRKEEVIAALKILGGHAHLSDIYRKVAEITHENQPKSFEAIIRGTLERNSSDSDAYDGRDDIFYLYGNKGEGEWGLRNYNRGR